MSTFTDEIFGMVCYTVSSKHNPREGVFVMKHEKIWKYTCFFVALALILYGVHLARIDAVLHGACKKQLTDGVCAGRKSKSRAQWCLRCVSVRFWLRDIRTIMQRSIGVRRYPHRKNINCCTKKDFSTI